MPTYAKNKQMLIRLQEYLKRLSDPKHPITTNELADLMNKDFQTDSKRTVRENISLLQEEGIPIIEISEPGKESLYYYDGQNALNSSQAKILIDAVAAARFIPEGDTEELINKLAALVSDTSMDKIKRHIYNAGDVKLGVDKLYTTIQTLVDAIDKGKMISFQYWDYDRHGHLFLKHDGKRYLASPYALVSSHNMYYLITKSEKDGKQIIIDYRIDRIADPALTETDAVALDFSIEEHVQTSFQMYSGKPVMTTLYCENEMMRYIIDNFGEDTETWTDEGDADHFYAKVMAADSRTFYGWVFGFNGSIEIEGPEEICEAYEHMLDREIHRVRNRRK